MKQQAPSRQARHRAAIVGSPKLHVSRRIAERAEIVGEILGELKGGSQQAARQLFELYYRPLYRYFANRGFPPDDCLDLIQETFLGIYTGIGSFRRQSGFDTWLFRIATNAYRKRRRWTTAQKRAGEEVSLDGRPGLDPTAIGNPGWLAPPPDDEALRKERVRLAREAIERMPQQMRYCLVLRIDHGLKYREIGVAMKLSTETVKAHLNQARRRLRKDLESYFNPELDSISSRAAVTSGAAPPRAGTAPAPRRPPTTNQRSNERIHPARPSSSSPPSTAERSIPAASDSSSRPTLPADLEEVPS